MTSVGYATLDIIPSFKGLQGQLDSGTAGPMRAAAAKNGALFGDVAGKSAGSRFGSLFKNAAKASMVGLAGAGALAFKFGGDALEEAREAQKVGAQTDATLKSTGKAAKVTAKDIGRLSGRLSDMAGIDDELIQSGANILLTFTKIRNEAGKGNKIFDAATKASLNMSVALGTDLKGASIQVGKALNDPVKGVTALGRAGVQFSEDQKKAIKKMVESGDVLGAQKKILKELDTQFAGSARAQATQADKLGVAFGNLKEDVGTALIPVMDDFAVFLRKKGIPAVRDFGGWVRDDFAPAVRNAAEDAKPLIKGAKDLADAFGDLPTAGKIASLGGALAGGIVIKHQFGKIFERGGPANPMFVTVMNPGGIPGAPGSGKPGSTKVPPILAGNSSLLNKFIKLGGPGGLIALSGMFADRGVVDHQGNPAKIATDEQNRAFLEKIQKEKAGVEGLISKVDVFKNSLDIVGSTRVRPELTVPGLREARSGLADFLAQQVEARKPVTPYINITPIERATAAYERMNAAARGGAQIERGVDNGITYQHGGVNPRAGVNINIENMQPHDYNDFLTQSQRRAQAAGLGGRP